MLAAQMARAQMMSVQMVNVKKVHILKGKKKILIKVEYIPEWRILGNQLSVINGWEVCPNNILELFQYVGEWLNNLFYQMKQVQHHVVAHQWLSTLQHLADHVSKANLGDRIFIT